MNQKIPSNLIVTEESFKSIKKKVIGGLLYSTVTGEFIHTNTIEEYQLINLPEIIHAQSQSLIADVKDFQNVNKFILVAFGDLKNYFYHSQFYLIELQGHFDVQTSQKINVALPKEEVDKISASLKPFIQNHNNQFAFLSTLNSQSNQYEVSEDIASVLSNPQSYLCYIDSSPLLPSVLLKNYLVKLNQTFQNESTLAQGQSITIKIISIRDKLSKLSENIVLTESVYFEVKLTKDESQKNVPLKVKDLDPTDIKATVISLKDQLDSKVIAENAVDLNLKLMKWRMIPTLNLDIIQKTSCLLLGSGSLGCQVSRNLLSWGFRKITFVDNGRVSYSNPVRQCLFTFEDSQRQDNEKAFVAAQRLKEIFPSVITRGEKLKIPMPGHAIGNNQEAIDEIIADTNRLEELIKEHDVVFLLTDSRESRWLPTVQCLAQNKICLTIALGFESYLVMRHGLSTLTHQKEINGNRLGCYFCNDVVAPRNSLADRTLDQQCTVSRPALCCIASSLGVELLVSMLNHPLKNGAKANEEKFECDKTELGILPQQIRGDLSSFGMNAMYGESFDRCIGCSASIVEQYMQNKDEFILRACNKPDYLEVSNFVVSNGIQDLTGITQMLAAIDLNDIETFDFDDEIE